MKTISTEFYRELYRIQDENPPSTAILLPSTERIYDVDLNTRTIEAPEFLSNYTDHASEVLYFKCDRFFDYMDLSTCTCVIQYVNAAGESRLYVVPFVDVATCSLEDKMLIPWCVDGNVTTQAGKVTFSIRFYKIDQDGKILLYNLSTQPATSQVLEGMNVVEANSAAYVTTQTEFERLVDIIQDERRLKDLYWTVLE